MDVRPFRRLHPGPARSRGTPGADADGLGLLAARTVFGHDKVLRLPTGTALGAPAAGYEIHHGQITLSTGEPFLGGVRSGNVFGTMWHGSLEGDELRRTWLSEAASLLGRDGFEPGTTDFVDAREHRINTLADTVEQHLDIEAILKLVTHGPPGRLPVLRGGLV